MSASEFLSHILFEFSYWHAMHDVPFKPRAYELASEAVFGLGNQIEETWRRDGIKGLKKLPGIGQGIAEKIDEYFRTGHIKEYEQFKKTFPVAIWELAQIEGMGPKNIQELWINLKVKNLTDLKKALAEHKVRALPRFGEKSEERIARGLSLLKKSSGRQLLGSVLPVADQIVKELSAVPGVKRCLYAGSLRRKQETIGDIDLIATAENADRVMEVFTHLPEVLSIHERGKTRSSVRLIMGIDADLRVVPDAKYGAVLQYFTGDKHHNVLLRERAIKKGYKLNEYGLFRGKKLIVCKTEEEIYQKLGMDTPPPELRIGADEIEAALARKLPRLLPYRSVRGDLQTQTEWTDGNASIKEMAQAAKKQTLEYIAITDHTKALAFINGLDEPHIKKQGKEIDKLNKTLDRRIYSRLLKGSEVDIHADGSLDADDRVLAELDWVGVSIHSGFAMDKQEMTKRIVHALQNPNVDCLFHPTGRLIGKRDPYAFDFDEVLAAAKKFRVALEIDCYPDRSDLMDKQVRAAVQAGVSLVIDTDAHDPDHFSFIPLGEAIARRGWAAKKDIINTKSLKDLHAWLEKKRKRTSWSA
ncbi:MAG TPA: DNA polymerase/3'-5' exonuclease PolX [Patescibacteria group bacterium]|nr:DNA polymerase/3'-5' exonuclease PolX [Patescibacteria group bacterium]